MIVEISEEQIESLVVEALYLDSLKKDFSIYDRFEPLKGLIPDDLQLIYDNLKSNKIWGMHADNHVLIDQYYINTFSAAIYSVCWYSNHIDCVLAYNFYSKKGHKCVGLRDLYHAEKENFTPKYALIWKKGCDD